MRVRHSPGTEHPDSGFALAEVLVSLIIVSILMAALAPFLATTIRVANLQTEQELASEVAVGSMEQVHRMAFAGLLTGRDKQSVDASYDDLEAPEVAPYLADMDRAWDSDAAPGTGELGSTRIRTNNQAIRLNGIQYIKRYYIGRCWQSSADAPCDISSRTGIEYYRVVVRVLWGNRLCPSNNCLYVISTLFSSATRDPVFNTNVAPTVNAVANQSTTVGAVATPVNLGYLGGTAPINWSITGQPPGITATSGGQLSGTPTSAGTYPVTSRAIDANGKVGSRTFTWTVT